MGSEARAESNNFERFGAVVAEIVADFFAEKHIEDVLDALREHVTPLQREAIASTSPVAGCVKCAFDAKRPLHPGKLFPTLHRCAELGRIS